MGVKGCATVERIQCLSLWNPPPISPSKPFCTLIWSLEHDIYIYMYIHTYMTRPSLPIVHFAFFEIAFLFVQLNQRKASFWQGP